MNEINAGVYPTMITPFTASGEVDYETAAKLTEWYIDKGCHGIFAVCQSSEMFFLSLEEKSRLARTVIQTAHAKDPAVSIVCSGHTSDDLGAQVEELTAMQEAGADAVVWVSNRLDQQQEGDAVWLKNAETLLGRLPAEMTLGIYECPVPYKRLLTPEILEWCKQTERFAFIKDTCCHPELLVERLQQLDGSSVRLFNANAQTLLHTLKNGAAGFSGIMANFYPELFVWLYENRQSQPEKAERLQQLITVCEYATIGCYPVSAKYAQQVRGVPMETYTRSVDPAKLGSYQKFVVDRTLELTEYAMHELGIKE